MEYYFIRRTRRHYLLVSFTKPAFAHENVESVHILPNACALNVPVLTKAQNKAVQPSTHTIYVNIRFNIIPKSAPTSRAHPLSYSEQNVLR